MKMKKLLAAALAVCMLLTMLPISVFAAETTTILDIQYDEENDDVVIYDENGAPILPDEDEDYYWDEGNWRLEYGVLFLFDGAFKVTSNIPLEMLIVSEGVTLVDGDISAYFVANEGTISGGNITVERMNYQMYNIDFAPGSFYNVGTISGKSNISCYGFQSGGEIGNTSPTAVMAEEVNEASAVINGGTINAKEYFFNHGTIKKGTITAGEEIYNHGMIENGTFTAPSFFNIPLILGEEYNSEAEGVESGVITGGTYNVSDFYNSDWYNGGAILSNAIVKGTLWNEYDAVIDMVTADYVISTAYEDNETNTIPGTITWKNDTPSQRSAREMNLWYFENDSNDFGYYIPELLKVHDTKTVNGNDDENVWDWELKQPMEQAYSLSPTSFYYYDMKVPSGYKLSLAENDVTLTRYAKEPAPVVEYEEETYDIVVRVKFDGVDEDEIDFVNAQLLKNGKAYKKAVKVDAKDEWRHEWTDLDDSSKIEWTVTADEIEGYNMEIENVRANYWTITLSKGAAEKANPETGADSFVGAAVALAVCSAVCGAALSLKK